MHDAVLLDVLRVWRQENGRNPTLDELQVLLLLGLITQRTTSPQYSLRQVTDDDLLTLRLRAVGLADRAFELMHLDDQVDVQLTVEVEEDMCDLSAIPIVDYDDVDQADVDQADVDDHFDGNANRGRLQS